MSAWVRRVAIVAMIVAAVAVVGAAVAMVPESLRDAPPAPSSPATSQRPPSAL